MLSNRSNPQTLLFHTPQQSFNQSMNGQPFFKHNHFSLREYIQKLEVDVQSATLSQTQYAKHFYKNELKAALYLNYTFIKICEQKQSEVQELLRQIGLLRKRINCFQQNQTITAFAQNQNNQDQMNKSTTTTPKRKFKQAFQAQKKILLAKFSQQKQDYKKIINKKDQILKRNKEQNIYLREKLISINQKVLQQEISSKKLSHLNQELAKQNQIFQSKINEYQQRNSQALNLSPIPNTPQLIKDEDISFNQFYSAQTIQENLFLRKQIQSLKGQIVYLKGEQQKLKSQAVQKSSIKYYQSLQNKYNQMKNQLLQRIEQIQRYRQISKQIQQLQRISAGHYKQKAQLQKQIDNLKKDLQIYRQKQQKNTILPYLQAECHKCYKFAIINDQLSRQLDKSRQKIALLKMKFDKTIHLQLNQRKQWDHFLNDLKEQPVE